MASTEDRKGFLAHYCEIDLSNIKSETITINAENDRREPEDEQICMWLMA